MNKNHEEFNVERNNVLDYLFAGLSFAAFVLIFVGFICGVAEVLLFGVGFMVLAFILV